MHLLFHNFLGLGVWTWLSWTFYSDSHEATDKVLGRLGFHFKLIQFVGRIQFHVLIGLNCPTFRGQPSSQEVQNAVVFFLAGHKDSISNI